LGEYYLPPFKTSVRDAHVGSIMCAYNAVDGVPSCASEYLLQDVLRDGYKFEEPYRYVTSDCSAVENIYQPHNFTDSEAAAAAVALNAGTDTCCGSAYLLLNESVANGWTTEAQMDLSLTRLYNALFTVGYFDGQPEYDGLSWSDVSTGSAQTTAYQAAWEGMTLLKNDGTLPLKTKYKSVALIGPWANATGQMQGNYQGIAPYLNSPLKAAQSQWGNVKHEMGTAINSTNTTGFASAIAAAKNAEVIIYLGGIDSSIENEGLDRTSIAWPGNQLDLIKQLSALGKPLIVIQFGGGQIDDSALLKNRHVNSLLWAGYPGQDGGPALIDVLVGKKSAAGRLPLTQYPADYINQVSLFDPNLRPSASSPGRTYKWLNTAPVLQFGYGLHYTTFKPSFKKTPRRRISIASLVRQHQPKGHHTDKPTTLNDATPWTTLSVRIRNTGKRTSDYVGLLFLASKNAGPAPFPNKSLVSYARLHDIAPGTSQDLELELNLGALARADANGDLVIYPGDYELLFDWDSRLKFRFTLTGRSVVLDPLVRQRERYEYTVPVYPKD
jgi:beta-D-xylosidase 4